MKTPTENNRPDSISEKILANAIRFLSIDAIQKANSGHPGLPMGMADVATVLFLNHLNFDPDWPDWPNRDRFILSAGHGSMLIYSLLYLSGLKDMTIEEIKNFRKLGSLTPGHPEYGITPGIETTTGPLGQGFGNAVGMAIAEKLLSNRLKDNIVNHWTYVIAGDGCLMEGISHEAGSLAGHLGLGKLIVFFDDNSITIDGSIELSCSDNTVDRFESLNWHVQKIDGHNPVAINQAIEKAKKSSKPSLIACKTIIGYGSPNKQGTSSVHGSALGEDEIVQVRKVLNWEYPPFEIPKNILNVWRTRCRRSKALVSKWQENYNKLNEKERTYLNSHEIIDAEKLNKILDSHKKKLFESKPFIATRKASEEFLYELNDIFSFLIGGSADLTGSNNTKTKNMEIITRNTFNGNYIHYGVREHVMASAMNGIALHGGLIPYGGTFLVFTDYLRPSLRLSALMKQRVIYVMTHDSIGLGEDGPTHQPVEHLSSLRSIPNLNVFRPADSVETAECWAAALSYNKTPSVIALSRQNLEQIRKSPSTENLSLRGAYQIASSNKNALVTLIGTGSETHLALATFKALEKEGIPSRVVSMPCWELFDKQTKDYKDDILQPRTFRIAIEAAAQHGWEKYIGENGAFIGLNSFGESAPYKDLFEHFNINVESIIKITKETLSKK